MAPDAKPRRRGRLFARFLLAGFVLLVALAAALPWLASTPPVRRWAVAKVNRSLAPAKLEIGAYRLGWFEPVRASGVVFRDKAGKAIVTAPRASLDRGLLGLVLSRPARAVLTIDGAAVDVERRADGSIDLMDALAGLTGSGTPPSTAPAPAPAAAKHAPASSRPDLTVKVVAGTLRVRAPELPDSFSARRVDLTVHQPSGPGPLTWQAVLTGPAEGDDAKLELSGHYDDRATGPAGADLAATLSGKNWPCSVNAGGVAAKGRFDGKIEAKRDKGLWALSGNPTVLGLDASGPALGGDRLLLERLTAVCDVTQSEGSWYVKRLDLGSPVATVKASGTLAETARPGASARLDAQLDLAALAKQVPHALRLREGLTLSRGEATLAIELRDGNPAEGRRLAVDAKLSDLVALDKGREIAVRDPATLVARVVRKEKGVRVDQLMLKTGFLNAAGSGDLDKGVTLGATIDLARLEAQFRDLIDFGAVELAGRGRLAADLRRGDAKKFLGRFAVEITALNVKGMTAEPIARGRSRLDGAVTGPADEAGWPQAWSFAQAGFQTDDINAAATLSTNPATRVVKIDEVRGEMHLPPVPGTTTPEVLRINVQGQYDPAAGTLDLLAKPGSAPEPLAIGPEGIHVVGLNQRGTGTTNANLSLIGDAARLDRALAWWTAAAPSGYAGTLTAQVGLALAADGGVILGAAVQAPDLSEPGTGKPGRRPLGPIALGLRADKPAAADRIDFSQLALVCRYGTVSVTGRIDEPSGRRLADLKGTYVPNWQGVHALLAESVEPGTAVKGEFRPFRVKGALSGANTAAILQGLDAELAIDKFEAVAFGLHLAPTPVVVRCGNKQVTIEPIATTINNGKTTLNPEVALDPNTGAISLKLDPGSAIEGAEINDEVSKKLLAYIAPVLNDATDVHGTVTVEVQQGDFPLVSNGRGHTTLTGKILFNNVEFLAGPFTSQLLGLVGKTGPQSLRMNQPILLSIANGRVNESGLSLPLGHDAKIELEGSVGFDSTLAMRARVPVPPKVAGNQPGLDAALEGLRVGIPIGGTLSRPTLDQRAFRVGLRDAGKTLLKKEGTQELNNVLKGLKGQNGGKPNGSKIEKELFNLLKPPK